MVSKKAIIISGVYTQQSGLVFRGNENRPGIQVDLVIDRKDDTITLCEMKYYTSEFVIDKPYARTLRNKVSTFREVTGTRKHVFLTVITTYVIQSNTHSLVLVDQDIDMDALFDVEAL